LTMYQVRHCSARMKVMYLYEKVIKMAWTLFKEHKTN
jgi:hypothetical protein